VTVTDLLKFLLELDQQWLTSRPSPCGLAAELVATLAEHAEPSLRQNLGGWRSVDLSPVRKPAPRRLSQPTLDAIQALEPGPIELAPTDRGFLRGEFADLNYERCSVQESSLATGRALWLGVDGSDARMHLSRATVAALLPLLERFAATGRLSEKNADA
jgi:hypothetical protein